MQFYYRQFKPSLLLTASGALLCAILAPAAHSGAGGRHNQASQAAPIGAWTSISDDVLKNLPDDSKRQNFERGTAGVSIDRTTGDIRMIVNNGGLWKSSDHAATFARVDGGVIGGRCETGYALNSDPASGRMACFMLDGKSGMTLDGGKSWVPLAPMGRGWDYGAVDWSVKQPMHILGVHHESGAELQHSDDGGKSWKLLGKDFTAVGIFNSSAFVASKGEGILRSTDGGATWTKVSDLTPTGRVLCVFKGVGYWVSREGLLVSKDKGETWSVQGSPIEAAWGPFLGRNERQIAVVGRVNGTAGLYRTTDAGKTWNLAAPFPQFEHESLPNWSPGKQWAAGWFVNFGWDPISDAFYASRMGHPTFKFGHN